MPDPYVFIGSSTEGKPFADALQARLRDVCEAKVWDQGFFSPGSGYLEQLTNDLDKFDFAILVLTPDDEVTARGVAGLAPRDNILLELGLFIGSIGRARTFAVLPEDGGVKLPSDLAGVQLVKFRTPQRGDVDSAVGPAGYDIARAITKLGLRRPPMPKQVTPDEHQEFERRAPERVEANKEIFGALAEAPSLDLWYSQLRPVLHQSSYYSTPTYWLDTNLNILDWNIAFETVFADMTPVLRYQHVNEFIARLTNYEDVFNHGREFSKRVQAGEEIPVCDMEPLVYRSRRYGDVTMLKVATQMHDVKGEPRGWVVALLPLKLEWELFRQDFERGIEEDKLWSVYAGSYDRVLQSLPQYQQLLDDVTSVVPEVTCRVLDVGAGTGNSTKVLLDKGHQVTSLEQNATMIDVMRSRKFDPKRHRVVKASADDLNTLRILEDASFEAATLVNVLYSLDDPFACLTGVNRILKPGGVVGLSTTHAGISLSQVLAAIKKHLTTAGTYPALKQDYENLCEINRKIERTVARRHTADKYREWVRDAGFEILRVEEYTYERAVMLIHARKVS